jgi:hypothetical protein
MHNFYLRFACYNDEAKVAGEKLMITNNGRLEAQVTFEARQDACVLVGASVTYSKPKAGFTGTPMFSGAVTDGKSNNQMLTPALLTSPQALGGSQPLHGITSKTALYRILYRFMGPFIPILTSLFPKFVTTTEQVGRAMIRIAKQGASKQILENQDLNVL